MNEAEFYVPPFVFFAFGGERMQGESPVSILKGIGPKTALQLIQTYGSVESVLESLHLLKTGQRTKIETDMEMLKLSKQLATIRRDVPIDAELEHLMIQPIESSKMDFLFDQGYTILARQLQR